eukprot:g2.t1
MKRRGGGSLNSGSHGNKSKQLSPALLKLKHPVNKLSDLKLLIDLLDSSPLLLRPQKKPKRKRTLQQKNKNDNGSILLNAASKPSSSPEFATASIDENAPRSRKRQRGDRALSSTRKKQKDQQQSHHKKDTINLDENHENINKTSLVGNSTHQPSHAKPSVKQKKTPKPTTQVHQRKTIPISCRPSMVRVAMAYLLSSLRKQKSPKTYDNKSQTYQMVNTGKKNQNKPFYVFEHELHKNFLRFFLEWTRGMMDTQQYVFDQGLYALHIAIEVLHALGIVTKHYLPAVTATLKKQEGTISQREVSSRKEAVWEDVFLALARSGYLKDKSILETVDKSILKTVMMGEEETAMDAAARTMKDATGIVIDDGASMASEKSNSILETIGSEVSGPCIESYNAVFENILDKVQNKVKERVPPNNKVPIATDNNDEEEKDNIINMESGKLFHVLRRHGLVDTIRAVCRTEHKIEEHMKATRTNKLLGNENVVDSLKDKAVVVEKSKDTNMAGNLNDKPVVVDNSKDKNATGNLNDKPVVVDNSKDKNMAESLVNGNTNPSVSVKAVEAKAVQVTNVDANSSVPNTSSSTASRNNSKAEMSDHDSLKIVWNVLQDVIDKVERETVSFSFGSIYDDSSAFKFQCQNQKAKDELQKTHNWIGTNISKWQASYSWIQRFAGIHQTEKKEDTISHATTTTSCDTLISNKKSCDIAKKNKDSDGWHQVPHCLIALHPVRNKLLGHVELEALLGMFVEFGYDSKTEVLSGAEEILINEEIRLLQKLRSPNNDAPTLSKNNPTLSKNNPTLSNNDATLPKNDTTLLPNMDLYMKEVRRRQCQQGETNVKTLLSITESSLGTPEMILSRTNGLRKSIDALAMSDIPPPIEDLNLPKGISPQEIRSHTESFAKYRRHLQLQKLMQKKKQEGTYHQENERTHKKKEKKNREKEEDEEAKRTHESKKEMNSISNTNTVDDEKEKVNITKSGYSTALAAVVGKNNQLRDDGNKVLVENITHEGKDGSVKLVGVGGFRLQNRNCERERTQVLDAATIMTPKTMSPLSTSEALSTNVEFGSQVGNQMGNQMMGSQVGSSVGSRAGSPSGSSTRSLSPSVIPSRMTPPKEKETLDGSDLVSPVLNALTWAEHYMQSQERYHGSGLRNMLSKRNNTSLSHTVNLGMSFLNEKKGEINSLVQENNNHGNDSVSKTKNNTSSRSDIGQSLSSHHHHGLDIFSLLASKMGQRQQQRVLTTLRNQGMMNSSVVGSPNKSLSGTKDMEDKAPFIIDYERDQSEGRERWWFDRRVPLISGSRPVEWDNVAGSFAPVNHQPLGSPTARSSTQKSRQSPASSDKNTQNSNNSSMLEVLVPQFRQMDSSESLLNFLQDSLLSFEEDGQKGTVVSDRMEGDEEYKGDESYKARHKAHLEQMRRDHAKKRKRN